MRFSIEIGKTLQHKSTLFPLPLQCFEMIAGIRAIRRANALPLRKAYPLLFGLLLCSSLLFSQAYLFDAKHITTEDGLANLMCMAVFKDRQGFVWAGTDYGLNRYDGSSFRLYTNEKNGLSSNKNIYRIREDAEGNLWLFYKNYIGDIPIADEIYTLDVFDPKTERAVPFDVYFAGKAPFKAAELMLPKVNDPKQRTATKASNKRRPSSPI